MRAERKDIFPLIDWHAVNEILKCVSGIKREDYIPEKGNPYPLCDNPSCSQARTCVISAHMEEDAYSQYDK